MYIYVYGYVYLEHVMGIKTSALEGQATACHMLVRTYVPLMFVCIYYSVYFQYVCMYLLSSIFIDIDIYVYVHIRISIYMYIAHDGQPNVSPCGESHCILHVGVYVCSYYVDSNIYNIDSNIYT